MPAQSAETQPLLQETRAGLAVALQELRELMHGINPPLLTERGLAAALEELCLQAALPTTLEEALDVRPPTQVATAAYFLVSEALANAAKHSHATEAAVSVRAQAGSLTWVALGGVLLLGRIAVAKPFQ
jgi:signal transduction histidine kinase